MKLIIIFIISFSGLYSQSMLSYDRSNFEIEKVLGYALKNTSGIIAKPVASEARALYELGHLHEVGLAVSYSNTLIEIQKEAQKDSLLKYTVVTPLIKGQLHIVVPKNSGIKTFHDLDGKSVNVGLKDGPLHLLSNAIAKKTNTYVKPYFFDAESALNGMLSGEGVDAVFIADSAPVKFLEKYSKYIRLINLFVPFGQDKVTIQKKHYGMEGDISTISTDLILLGKKDSLSAIVPPIQTLINNVIEKNEVLCTEQFNYPVKISTYFQEQCQSLLAAKSVKGGSANKVEPPKLVLNKTINSVEDIEIYMDALLKNTAIGGLSKITEEKKIKQLVKFINDSKSKVMIKSYSNKGDAYQNANRISKLLRKEGVSRGGMIIKTFNQSTFAADDHYYSEFLNTKILFELY